MRIAVLGLGFMGSTHLKALRNIPRAQLAAVYSNDEQKLSGDLSSIQGNLGGPGEKFDFSGIRKYRGIPELLSDASIDAVDICLPTHLHAPTALEALRAGKHVLVEKPMALDGETADLLIDEASRQGGLLMVAQVLRFVPPYRALARELASKTHGPIRSAIFRRRCAAPAWSPWLGDVSKSGGGVFDLLIHDVDMCLALFGQPEAVAATGYEDLAQGIDTIHATFYYGPFEVVITGGWHHRKAYPFSMEYTVTTEGATFDFSSITGLTKVYDAAGGERDSDLPEQDGFEAELAYFVDCCEEKRRPELCPPEESSAAVKLTRFMAEARKRNGEKITWR